MEIMLTLHDIKTKDISIVLFDNISGLSNMWHINTQQAALDHRVEIRDLNATFHNDEKLQLEGVGRDFVLQDLQETWH